MEHLRPLGEVVSILHADLRSDAQHVNFNAEKVADMGLENYVSRILSAPVQPTEESLLADIALYSKPLLEQFFESEGKSADNAAQDADVASEDLASLVVEIFGSEKSGGADDQPVPRRGLLSWRDFFRRLKCKTFAALSVPGYIILQRSLEALNSSKPRAQLTKDLKYFAYPIHGDLVNQNWGSIVYSAHVAPTSVATTMPGVIYVKDSEVEYLQGNDAFQKKSNLMIHELQHIKQYQAVNNNPLRFGFDYLYEYCIAGLSYSQNKFEVQADASENKGKILWDRVRYFDCWRDNVLEGQLGYPTQTTILNDGFLNFQRGRLDAGCTVTGYPPPPTPSPPPHCFKKGRELICPDDGCFRKNGQLICP
jgi:hypothetical protein